MHAACMAGSDPKTVQQSNTAGSVYKWVRNIGKVAVFAPPTLTFPAAGCLQLRHLLDSIVHIALQHDYDYDTFDALLWILALTHLFLLRGSSCFFLVDARRSGRVGGCVGVIFFSFFLLRERRTG
ncbi:hypothetical protein BJX99DRAFT_242331 [Aspergillus californicus]